MRVEQTDCRTGWLVVDGAGRVLASFRRRESAVAYLAAERDRRADFAVRVFLLDDDGHARTVVAYGATVEDAVRSAEDKAGGSYVMTDWGAA